MMHAAQGSEAAPAVLGVLFLMVALLVALAVLVLTIVIWWKIFSKAGYSGAMGLLMLLPIVNLVMLLVLAFGHWPVLRELERLRQFHAGLRPQ